MSGEMMERVEKEVGLWSWMPLSAGKWIIGWVNACSLLLLLPPPMTNTWLVRKDSSPAHANIVAHVVAVHHTPIIVTLNFLPLFLFGIPKSWPHILPQVLVRSFGVVVAEAHCCCADAAAAQLLLLIQTATCTSRFRVGFRKVFGGCCRRRVVLVVERMGRYIEDKLIFGMELSDSWDLYMWKDDEILRNLQTLQFQIKAFNKT